MLKILKAWVLRISDLENGSFSKRMALQNVKTRSTVNDSTIGIGGHLINAAIANFLKALAKKVGRTLSFGSSNVNEISN